MPHLANDWTEKSPKGLDAPSQLSLQYLTLPTDTAVNSGANSGKQAAISGHTAAATDADSAATGSVF